mmetsp:Transcript_9663/g.18554  ORF Transcript_9663/g.18554 Transcript_9663/m.18554 type:complete len:563 (+) Transcript_9663:1290-2978(+)
MYLFASTDRPELYFNSGSPKMSQEASSRLLDAHRNWKKLMKTQNKWEEKKVIEVRKNKRQEINKASKTLTKEVFKAKVKCHQNLDERIATGDVEALKQHIKHTTKKKKSHVHTLEQKGVPITDPMEKAEIMSKQYTDVSNKPPSAEERPHLFPQTEQYADLKQYTEHARARAIQLNAANHQDLKNTFKVPTVEEFDAATDHINKKATPGADGVTGQLLESALPHIKEKLIMLMKVMWVHTVSPTHTKINLLLPILKTGKDTKKAESYRPIAINSIITKLMEHICANRVRALTEHIPTLFNKQTGWLIGKSLHEPILMNFHTLRVQQNDNKYTGILKLDLRKMYDTIDRKKLKIKLQSLNINNNLLEWIMMQFNETQYVTQVQGCRSTPQRHEIGIPQGSLLSPLLAAIYTEDAPDFFEGRHIRNNKRHKAIKAYAYADDKTITIELKHKDDMKHHLQKLIPIIEKWAALHSLQYNAKPGKSEYTLIHPWNGKKHTEDTPDPSLEEIQTPLAPALRTKTLNRLEKPLLQAQKIVVGVHTAARILDVAALFGEPRRMVATIKVQ